MLIGVSLNSLTWLKKTERIIYLQTLLFLSLTHTPSIAYTLDLLNHLLSDFTIKFYSQKTGKNEEDKMNVMQLKYLSRQLL